MPANIGFGTAASYIDPKQKAQPPIYGGQPPQQGAYMYGGQPPPGQSYSYAAQQGGPPQGGLGSGGQQQGGQGYSSTPNYYIPTNQGQQPPQGNNTPYPTGWDADKQPGLKFNPQTGGWDQAAEGADVTWDSGSNTYYYHGKALTQDQLNDLNKYGPSSLGGAQALQGQNWMSTASALGYGQAPMQVNAPQLGPMSVTPQAGQIDMSGTNVGYAPSITAPHVTAEQGGFQNFDQLQNALYHSQFDPTQRELTRQQGLADQRMAAQLAQAGIAESGTGVAQRAFQSGEYDRQITAASQDAATKAATQRYGMEYTQSMENAKMRQEANFQNANMDLTAQTENARNILTANVTSAQLRTQAAIAQGQMETQANIAGAQIQSQRDIANADNYLKAMGLNMQSAQNARQDWMSMMQLQETDMARMDAYNLSLTELGFNTYLKQLAIVQAAGQQSTGKTDASSSSMGGSIQGGLL